SPLKNGPKKSNVQSSTSKPTQASKSPLKNGPKKSNVQSSTSKPTQASKSPLKNGPKKSNVQSSTSNPTQASKSSSKNGPKKSNITSTSKPTPVYKSSSNNTAKKTNVQSSTSKPTKVTDSVDAKVSDKPPKQTHSKSSLTKTSTETSTPFLYKATTKKTLTEGSLTKTFSDYRKHLPLNTKATTKGTQSTTLMPTAFTKTSTPFLYKTSTPFLYKTTKPTSTNAANLPTAITLTSSGTICLTTTNLISKNIHITSSTSLSFSTDHPYKPSLTSTFVTRTKPHKPPHSKTPKNDNPPPPPPRVSKNKDKPYIPAITGTIPLATPTATVSLEDLPSAIFVQEITNAISKQNNVKISPDKVIVTKLLRSQDDDSGFVYMKVPKTQTDNIENVLTNKNSQFYKNDKSLFRNLGVNLYYEHFYNPSLSLDNSVADSQDENVNNSSNNSSNGIGAIIVIAVCGSTLLYAGLTALVVRAYRRSKNRASAARQNTYNTYTYSVQA
ncbi:5559_t:CDS:2, partial [Racocetra fulgida]